MMGRQSIETSPSMVGVGTDQIEPVTATHGASHLHGLVVVEAPSGGVVWTPEDEARLDAAIAKRAAARRVKWAPEARGGEAMNKWQPIETAPKDGNEVLLFLPGELHSVCTGIFVYDWCHSSAGRFTPEDDFFGDSPLKPTHWMPLPSPPDQR